MTKREINEAISAANGALAWARAYMTNGDMASAAAQCRLAQVACASAAVRCDEYAAEKKGSA